MWAEEEQMNGKNVFYWHIMSSRALNTISTQVPTSLEELSELGILGENVVKEYGERLIKNINAFVENQHLQKYIDKHRASVAKAKKRPRVAASAASPKKTSNDPIVVDMTTDDEFDNGIDFSAIELPPTAPAATVPAQVNNKHSPKKSAYFQGMAAKKLSKYGNK